MAWGSLALGGLELADNQVSVRDVSQACAGEAQDFRRAGRDIYILPVVTAEQRNDLCLETPATSLGICGDTVSEVDWKTDGSSDEGLLGESGA